jgi:hypothetical protein
MTDASGVTSTVPWSFQDCGTDVLVKLAVSKSDVDVQITGDSLVVRHKGSGKDASFLRILQLFSTVDAAASGIDDEDTKKDEVVIRLKKLDSKAPWPQVGAAETASQSTHASTENPLKQREAVGALLVAARDGSIDAFKTAAQHFDGKELQSVKDGNGRTALHFAAAAGHTDFVQYLISEEHFAVNCVDESGEGCLPNAYCVISQEGTQSAEQTYLPAGDTALALAAGSGHASTMQALLSLGADPVLSKEDGPQPIHRAASSGKPSVA